MLFNSPEFLLIFLPLAIILFVAASKYSGGRAAHVTLILSSLFFYSWWDYRYVFLIVASTAFNYVYGGWVLSGKSKIKLGFGILINVLVLGYFKYTNFALENLAALLGSNWKALEIVLPLGISFFTFQKIGYLVDCYKGKVHDRDPLRFALFVLFFPQLIAGPIVHHNQIIPQLVGHEKSPLPSESMVSGGLILLLVGLVKKVVIADNIANIVSPGFDNASSLQFIEAWTVAIGYSLQLYFDFSAYSEMAMGLGMLFGIRLAINFNSPYKASSITDFWRRWHITLGAFMREYLYIPLGGARRGYVVMVVASMLTMLVGGLWHGAAWTFILWGFMHGLALVINKTWSLSGRKLPEKIAVFLTLTFVIFAWIPFRANSISDAFFIWSKMTDLSGISLPMAYQALPMIKSLAGSYHISNIFNGFEILGLFVVLYFTVTAKNVHEYIAGFAPGKRNAGYAILASLVGLFSLSKPSMFLYFNF